MTTMTKIPSMRGVNSRISDLKAATCDLTMAEKHQLLEILSKDVEAAASVADAPKRRLAAVSAAAASKDKRTSGAYKLAVASLGALGLKIDAIAASGDISHLDKLMKAQGWTSQRKIALKNAIDICGAA